MIRLLNTDNNAVNLAASLLSLSKKRAMDLVRSEPLLTNKVPGCNVGEMRESYEVGVEQDQNTFQSRYL